jgi:hypothetical protein
MENKENYIDKILQDIFNLSSPKIQEVRREQITEFIGTTVNGDTINAHLVIDVMLNNKPGVYVYILTDIRLIQIQIDADKEISSLTYLLSEIIGVERKLIDTDRIEIQIIFKNGLVGLKYSEKDQKITVFFQKVEQTWAKRG